jgi:tetratricopeptide (TPR) repeat protein
MKKYMVVILIVMVAAFGAVTPAQHNSGNEKEAKEKLEKARKEGRIEKRIELATEAIELKEDYTDAYIFRGEQYYADNRPDNALLDFSKAVVISDTCSGAYFPRGKIYRSIKIYSLAREDFTLALNLDPGNLTIRKQIDEIADSVDVPRE